MDIKKEREAFERYYIANHHDGDIHPNQQLLEWSKKGEFYFATSVNDLWDMWLAAKQRAVPDGFVVVSVEPTKNIVDKLEDIASCQPSYGGDDIYKVAIGVLDYDWKSGLKAMIQEAQR